MIHRCRFNWGGGMAEGDHRIIFNFLNLIKATLTQFSPNKVYFAIDGKPKLRLDRYPEYKANRKKELTDPEEIKYWDNFKKQKRYILNMVKEHFSFVSIYDPNNEADDLIYYACKKHNNVNDEITVISSDSDLIQIINEQSNVKLYNPIAKKYRTKTEYDYVSFKAMVGDRSDNIPGVPRIGKITAEKILKSGSLSERLQDSAFKEAYTLSYSLIKLTSDIPSKDIQEWSGNLNKAKLKSEFERMAFKSLIKNNYINSLELILEGLKVQSISM